MGEDEVIERRAPVEEPGDRRAALVLRAAGCHTGRAGGEEARVARLDGGVARLNDRDIGAAAAVGAGEPADAGVILARIELQRHRLAAVADHQLIAGFNVAMAFFGASCVRSTVSWSWVKPEIIPGNTAVFVIASVSL